ncbi:MAG: preprotein translocase subunit YajC [Methylobacillus sp.]|nr:preprotein translocase subunit YajC [Methylobacillus sp.]
MFISNAYAAATPSASSEWMAFLPFIVIIVAFFMLMRSQSKQAREHRKLMETLQKGDEVVTAGGLAGKVTKVDDNFVALEIAPNLTVQIQKHAIQTQLPKGSL